MSAFVEHHEPLFDDEEPRTADELAEEEAWLAQDLEADAGQLDETEYIRDEVVSETVL